MTYHNRWTRCVAAVSAATITRFIPVLLGLLVATPLVATPLAAQATAQATAVTVREAWVREAAAGRAVTGAFLILENTSDAARALVRGKASVGDTLELHEMKRENGMMRMSPVPRIDIPAKGSVALRPGGYHLMLFGLKAPLAAGDTVRLTLTFDDGTTAQVKAPVRPMQGMPQ